MSAPGLADTHAHLMDAAFDADRGGQRGFLLVQDWLDASDPSRQKALAAELARLTMDEVPYVGLGQWFGKTAYRKNITGVLEGMAPYPWNVRPA